MSLRDRELCLSLTGICVFADRFYVQSATRTMLFSSRAFLLSHSWELSNQVNDIA